MKKLMTMLAAVGMAFGLFADADITPAGAFVSGTHFDEEVSEGVKQLTPGATFLGTEGDQNGFWSGISTSDNQNKVSDEAWTLNGITPPDQYADDGNGLSLAIKTTIGNPIFRKAKMDGSGIDMLGDGNGAFVDMVTKFTMFEDAPTINDATAKLAIWLQEVVENDEIKGTNVWIQAAKFTTGGENIEPSTYDCGSAENYDVADWNRVTVKAIKDITAAGDGFSGFVVFINGKVLISSSDIGDAPALTPQAQGWAKDGKLFPSMVLQDQTITGIAFDGTGSVDDIAFTTLPPSFAGDLPMYTVSWDDDVATLIVGGENIPVAGKGSASFTVKGGSVAVAATYGDGCCRGAWTLNGDATTLSEFTFKKDDVLNVASAEIGVTVQIGGETLSFGTFAEAVAAANAAGSAAKITLVTDLSLNSALTVANNTNGVVIDLAGKALTYAGDGYAITATVPLTITDSTETPGEIESANGVVTSSANLTIDKDVTLNGPVAITAGGTGAISAGIFKGTFTAQGQCITGGKFKNNPAAYLATGYTAPYDEASGYYIVGIGEYDIIYYDEDGNEITGLTPATYTYNQAELNLPDGPDVTGKTFVEWQNEDGSKFVYEKGQTGEIEVYAAYDAKTYTIKFLDKDDQQIGDAQTVAYNVMPVAPNAPVVTGMSFEDWTPAVVPAIQNQDYKATYTANVYKITYTYKDDKGENVDVTNTNPTEFTFGYGASFDATKLEYDTAAYEFKEFTPGSIGTDVAGDQEIAVTFTKKASDPVDPGVEKKYESTEEAAAARDNINNNKDTMIKVPTEAEATKTAYLERVAAKVKADGLTVVVDIADGKVATFQGELDTEIKKATVAAALTDAEATTATITTVAGFYYWIEGGVDVGTINLNGTPKIGNGSTVTLDKPELGTTTKAFYKLAVGVKSPAITGADD